MTADPSKIVPWGQSSNAAGRTLALHVVNLGLVPNPTWSPKHTRSDPWTRSNLSPAGHGPQIQNLQSPGWRCWKRASYTDWSVRLFSRNTQKSWSGETAGRGSLQSGRASAQVALMPKTHQHIRILPDLSNVHNTKCYLSYTENGEHLNMNAL